MSALIPEVEVHGEERTEAVRTSALSPNRYQPRRTFTEEALEELAASIRQHGVIQPLIVRRSEGGYEIIAGERRWRAAQLAGLETVPVVVRDLSDDRLLTIALVENLQRENLGPLEEAAALDTLMRQLDLNQEALAAEVGRSRPYVANALRLLQLGQTATQLLSEGRLTAGHARALLGAKEPLQGRLARQVADRGLTVRQTEALVARSARPGPAPKATRPGSRPYPEWEDRLRQRLGARVQIEEAGGRGKVVVSYSGRDQLEAILESVLGKIDAG